MDVNYAKIQDWAQTELAELKNTAIQLFSTKYPDITILKVYAVGSRLTNYYTENSDIDVAIVIDVEFEDISNYKTQKGTFYNATLSMIPVWRYHRVNWWADNDLSYLDLDTLEFHQGADVDNYFGNQ